MDGAALACRGADRHRRAGFGLDCRVFATALPADLAPAAADGTVHMRWSTAGHLPAVFIAPDGAVSLLRASPIDPPLGVSPTVSRHDELFVLQPGSVVLLYTDGLILNDAVLPVSELAGNALRHGQPPARLILDSAADTVRIGVSDSNPVLPSTTLSQPDPDRASGQDGVVHHRRAVIPVSEMAPGRPHRP